jgi:hypothetical protein
MAWSPVPSEIDVTGSCRSLSKRLTSLSSPERLPWQVLDRDSRRVLTRTLGEYLSGGDPLSPSRVDPHDLILTYASATPTSRAPLHGPPISAGRDIYPCPSAQAESLAMRPHRASHLRSDTAELANNAAQCRSTNLGNLRANGTLRVDRPAIDGAASRSESSQSTPARPGPRRAICPASGPGRTLGH